jgi:hypothetical protein
MSHEASEEEVPTEEELRRLVSEINASAPQSKKDFDLARKALIEDSIDSQIIANRYFNRAAIIIPLLTLLMPLLSNLSWSKALIVAVLGFVTILVIKSAYLFAARRNLTAKSAALSKQHYQDRYK